MDDETPDEWTTPDDPEDAALLDELREAFFAAQCLALGSAGHQAARQRVDAMAARRPAGASLLRQVVNEWHEAQEWG
jgi:hypothetical protein